MREAAGYFANVVSKAVVAASVFPTLADAVARGPEDRDESIVEVDGITELASQLVQADLGDIGPDAEDVRHVGDLDRHSYTM